MFEQHSPASPRFIANFRIQEQTNPNFIDLAMKEEQPNCSICLEEFCLNDSYAKWPCSSPIPHIFHSNCMLKVLRAENTCPLCRDPVETLPIQRNNIVQLLRTLAL